MLRAAFKDGGYVDMLPAALPSGYERGAFRAMLYAMPTY